MATVYKIEIETVSLRVNHPPADIEKIFKDFLDNYEDEYNTNFENTEIKVERK